LGENQNKQTAGFSYFKKILNENNRMAGSRHLKKSKWKNCWFQLLKNPQRTAWFPE
jgi:hypothetical protein